MSSHRHGRTLGLVVCASAIVAAACGKKGPPLAPLHLVPGPATDVSVRRLGDDVQLRFVLPARNINGPGPIELDHLEVYAVTIAAGAPPPPNRELLGAKYVVGTIPVKPPPVEGEPEKENAAPDTRPAAGEPATFVDTLTPDKLKPVAFDVPKPAAAPATPAVPPAAAAAPAPTYPVRIYAIRGITKGGRPGQPAARVQVPIVTLPGPPADVKLSFTESALQIAWSPPPAVPDGPAVAYNVYRKDGTTRINGDPIAAPPYERGGVAFGTEECFTVRAVETIAGIAIESPASAPACVTPQDTFPPAAPKDLKLVAGAGLISLIWDANTEPDLAGYLVLRGEAPGDKLQPLMAAPLAGTSFEDKTVKPGVRYAYAIVAVDKATPPNTSAPSARQEETAR